MNIADINIPELLAKNEGEGQRIAKRLQELDSEKQILIQQLLRLEGAHQLLVELS